VFSVSQRDSRSVRVQSALYSCCPAAAARQWAAEWEGGHLAMARYIVLYRISRYWGRIVAYLYRDNYPSNEVDIPHNSQLLSASVPSMPSATSTKGVSCSVAGASKVTLIGSNCPASRVGRCVDCKGGRTAQAFSDCAITKYLSRTTARQPCGRQTIAAVESLHSCYCLAASTHSSPAE